MKSDIGRDIVDRVRDLAEQAGRRGYITNSAFLSPAERVAAENWLKKNVNYAFAGGYEGAERQVCFLLPDYKDGLGLEAFEVAEVVCVLRLNIRAQAAVRASMRSGELSHRDYLGSLLGLGIRRDQIGDILVDDEGAFVFCLASICGFIESNLVNVGVLSVSVSRVSLADVEVPEREVEIIRVTAASPRLDRVAASGFGVSRTQMTDYIRGGNVMVNWQEELRPDREVVPGTTISLRGHGRIVISSDEGLSRKGRHILLIERPK